MDEPDAPRLYLPEWITVRGMTLEQLAAEAGLSKTHVAQLKSGKRDWNVRVLVKLAKGLGLRDPLSLFRPPTPGAERADIWDRIPPARRAQADQAVDRVLEAFADPPETAKNRPD